MAQRVIERVLLRAPLLPVALRGRAAAKVFTDPLARAALSLASPDLVRGPAGARKAAALANYVTRASFRPTPHGLWAGVMIGELGPRTEIASGKPRAHLTVSWGRLVALGRALLAEPATRDEVRLRAAPSLMRDADRAQWLDLGEGAQAVERVAELDDLLRAVLDACSGWRQWPEVRAAAAAISGVDADGVDDYLLVLIDDGLLAHDLAPPLIGPPPLEWMRVRLGGQIPALDLLPGMLGDLARPIDARLEEAGALVDTLPGSGGNESLHAVLVHEPPHAPMLSRVAVERAAALAPLLFRLQEELAPPAAEYALDSSVEDAVSSVTELYGAGALDLGALARGDYGVVPSGEESEPELPRLSGPLATLLVERLLCAARDGEQAVELHAQELEPLLPDAGTPPTFELFLAPAKEPRGTPAGTGWLLGTHAPAGSTWGRFAEALGGPLTAALEELAEQEHLARPSEHRLDVAFTPSRGLADLCTHPPIRRAALALSSWPAGPAVTTAELALVADDAALAPRALRDRQRPVAPSPLHRLRSTTAPPGVFRLLAGWSLFRQHAPWALTLGPLAGLSRVPRIVLDGFVISPASWRLPDPLTPAAFRRWRREAKPPKQVQVGREDELLLIDLDSKSALRTLAALPADERARAWEVWPPLDAKVDRDGRRIEAVVAVVDEPDADESRVIESADAAVVAAGSVAPPRVQPAAGGWSTYKIFGAPDRADRVIAHLIWPLMQEQRADGWFFLRYVDGPGARHHLRLRVRGKPDFGAALEARLAPAFAAGDVVSVETAPYHRELARYGADAIDAVERIFEADSELCCALLADEAPVSDGTEVLVRVFDSLTLELGLDLPARRSLARRRRLAYDVLLRDPDGSDRLAEEHRARQSGLQGALTCSPAPPFDTFGARVSSIAAALPRASWEALLPALLHMSAVRLAGSRREEEARAYYFWERTLDGLTARALRSHR